ncbi:MAG TPA: family 78 glycoside hydrolase catalytic domain [Verrucomicrobiae bacterium]|jgi:alpha-L-rhamnosidase|nr:family 78 glycoside hydrolase catalytic domain [Verrucomicrobiae bacterium]
MSQIRKLLIGLLALVFPFALQAVGVSNLRCEDLADPVGIDPIQPRLSWILDSSECNQNQAGYEILVATSEKNLARNDGDLWNSGKILSDQSVQVVYAGKPLGSYEQCFWKARVWDKEGKVSAWSRPAFWTMGILTPADWNGAKWIGLNGTNVTDYLAGTSWIWSPSGASSTNYFRKVIIIPTGRKVVRAQWVYTGDNECRGWLNGFDLGARNNYHTVRDDDITGRLDPGSTNVFAFTGYNFGSAGKPAGIVGLLTIEFDRGAPMLVPTDDSWKVSDQETSGWNKTGFDDSNWTAAEKLGPVGIQPWGNVRVSESRRLPARYLRKDFSAAKTIRRAAVCFSGLGLSELYLNGAKVGDAVLSPAFTQYNKRAFYVAYDVTGYLRRGENAIGVILGNGRFFADRSHVYSGTESFGWPKLLLNLRIEYSDGSISEIVSDNSWKLTADGPIVANNDYDGEEYDARKEFSGWDKIHFDDSRWQPAQIVSAPCENITAQMQEPIRVTQTIKPISVHELSPGDFIYDLGQNIVGWCRLRVSGPAGTQVTLRHAETLKPDGSLNLANLRSARATDIYTLKGNGLEVWEPRFVTHGFRYVEVTGFPGRPGLNSIEGRVVNDDLPVTGSFETSNPLFNKIYRAIVWGVRGNYRSVPTDCPQRDERQGWLGDRSEESRGETFLFDNSKLYSNWMQDIADAQRTSGSLPDIAPTYWPFYSDNVSWPSTFIIVPEMLREQFADAQTVARNYDSAKKWMDYMSRWVANGIIARDSYGDWCVPPENPLLIHSEDPNRVTDKALIATAYFYHDCKLMEDEAKMLGKDDDSRQFHLLAEQIKTAFNEKFLDRGKGQYSNGTQTSCVLPLAFGLVPDGIRERVFNHLVDKIENDSHGHIGTGLIGGQYLMRVLTENGRPDLAFEIASQKDYPSWGHMIEHGATTIWELWNGDTADPTMNSGNHVMLVGDLVIWFYEDLAGIKSDPAQPGFKHIIMSPTPTGDLTWVKASHLSPYGKISSEWHSDEGKFDWQVEIPANATATAYVPATGSENIKSDGVKPIRFGNGRAVFELGAGKYHFISELK